MEAIVVLVLGIAVVATAAIAAATAIVSVRRRGSPSGRSAGRGEREGEVGAAPPGPIGPRHLAPTRIVVVGATRPSIDPRPEVAAKRPGPSVGPRRRLLRDASAVLFAIAAVALAASTLASGSGPSGGVLSATGAPRGAATAPADGAAPGRSLVAPGGVVGTSAARSTHPTASAIPGASSAPPDSASASAPDAAPTRAAAVQSATAAPEASATVPPSREPGIGALPSAGRLALLTPCRGRADCYLYVVRRGDTLLRIATFFGIAPADILRLNPAIADPAIVVRGSTLVLPTPTR